MAGEPVDRDDPSVDPNFLTDESLTRRQEKGEDEENTNTPDTETITVQEEQEQEEEEPQNPESSGLSL